MRTTDSEQPSSVPGVRTQGLSQASAFKDLEDLLKVVSEVLNSVQGQEALDYLDCYEAQAKTRFALTMTAKSIQCENIDVRVFKLGVSGTKKNRLINVCVVVDSNLGGMFPIKIVTAFPCDSNPKLEVGLSEIMQQTKTVKDNVTESGGHVL